MRELGPVLYSYNDNRKGRIGYDSRNCIREFLEQIDALETMNINPIKFLVSPRIGAALICFPILTAIFDIVGITGGFITGSGLLGLILTFTISRSRKCCNGLYLEDLSKL